MINLNRQEKILLEARKHWFIFLIESIGVVLFALFPIFIFIFLSSFIGPYLESIPFYILTFLYFAWLILVWIYFFLAWTDYYLDVLIVTDFRIIEIEQRGLFNREVSSFYLNRVQDITIEIPGFLPTVLDYGHLHIQTAGEQREFIMSNIATPHRIKAFILKKCSENEDKEVREDF